MRIAQANIALKDALRIKSAEFWMQLGQPIQALLELEHLPKRARKHPWARQTFLIAFHIARQFHEHPFSNVTAQFVGAGIIGK